MMKVLIIATPRSGSTNLTNSIKLVYGIKGFYEPFNPNYIGKPYDYDCGDHVIKTLIAHYSIDELKFDKYTHIICLTRKNILEAAQSYDYHMEYRNEIGEQWHHSYYLPKSDKKTRSYEYFKYDFDRVSSISDKTVYYEDLYLGSKEQSLKELREVGLGDKCEQIYDQMMKTPKYRKLNKTVI